MTIAKALRNAKRAAHAIRRTIAKPLIPKVGVILGTGWGDTLQLDNAQERPLSSIPGFEALNKLDKLAGHDRVVVCGMVDGVWTIALRGRIHLNEHPTDQRISAMVRLQVQALLELGVRKFILTNAAGSLTKSVKVGSIVVADGFVTTHMACPMPLFAGEFCSPEDRLMDADRVVTIAKAVGFSAKPGGYALMRGPYFEGRKYDKTILANTGAKAVGMSIIPEACVISTYQDTQIACVSYITNSHLEEHSHETNQARAKADAPKLGDLLQRLIVDLMTPT